MKEVNLNYQIKAAAEAERKQLINDLLKNKKVQDFLRENDLGDDFVNRYAFKLRKWLVSISKCQNCKGLSECRQEVEGEYYDIFYDKVLDIKIEKCNYALNKKAKEKHLKYFVYSDIPEPLNTLRFSDIEKNTDLASDIEYANSYYQVFDWFHSSRDTGLFLSGSVGVGKTYILTAIANEYALNKKRVAFIHVPTFVNYMKNIVYNDSDLYRRLLNRINNANLVIFDDLGAESVTHFVRDDLLLPILNFRMDNDSLTLFTSNEDFESLQDHYSNSKEGIEIIQGERVIERIKKLSNLINFIGSNKRHF